MILVYGHADDPPTAGVAAALRTRGSPFCLLDQGALAPASLAVDLGADGVSGTVHDEGRRIALAQFDAVFARPLDLGFAGGAGPAAAGVRRQHELLMEWLDETPARVVNRPAAMQSNGSKPLQLQLIGAAGLAVPETLVTSDAAEARAFRAAHGRVIFKSTSGVRSIVRELDDTFARRLDRLATLPVQFQALVPGVDVRVHVVGTEAFAVEIRTEAIDYRYASRDNRDVAFAAITLPHSVSTRCIDLTRRLGLALAGIDLRRRPDGEYVCFEVNPMPAFSYFEHHGGLPIADAVARLLGGDMHATQETSHGSSRRQPDRHRRHDHRHPAAPVA